MAQTSAARRRKIVSIVQERPGLIARQILGAVAYVTQRDIDILVEEGKLKYSSKKYKYFIYPVDPSPKSVGTSLQTGS